MQKETINILLSFPRTGNTWTRYIVEYISKKPTVHRSSIREVLDGQRPKTAIGDYTNIDINIDDDVILLKRHFAYNEEDDWSVFNGRFIFLVRDYKECIIRNLANQNEATIKNSVRAFANNLKFYDKYNGEKIIVYY